MNIYDYAVKWDWCHYSYVTWCHYTVQKLCKYVLWWLEYSGMVRVITHKCTVWWWWLDCYVAANHWAQSVTLGKRIWLLGVITKSVVRKPNIATHAKSVVFYIVLQHCITTCFVISHHSKPTNRFTSFVILSTQEWTSMTLNSLDVQSCQKWVVTIFIQNPHWTIELWIDHSQRFTQANTGYNPFQSKSYPKGIMGQFLSIPSYCCFSIQLAPESQLPVEQRRYWTSAKLGSIVPFTLVVVKEFVRDQGTYKF